MSHPVANPIIPGFAPDPSVALIGDTFFLVNSTFHLFPGLPIYASKDLKTWTQIGNAFNRQTQLSLRLSDTKLHQQPDGSVMLATGGLYAPTIRHNEWTNTTYVICTNIIHPIDGGADVSENFILSTKDIWSDEWSDAVPFDFRGIDPSIFWDDEGKAYICGSAAPGPMTKIDLFEVDLATGRKLSPQRTIWGGTGGIYPEGPHIYRKDGMYYLLISEGGTFTDHMITVARSDNIWGPYEANPSNPILTARDTQEYVQCTGHCDLFQDRFGEWWGVCLGIRMRGNRYIMGRETFLTSGSWEKGSWPMLDQVSADPEFAGRAQLSEAENEITTFKKGADFLYIRDADLRNYEIETDEHGNIVTLKTSKFDHSQPLETVTFIGKRQRKLEGKAHALLEISNLPDGINAGLAYYKDEHRYVNISYNSTTKSVSFEAVNNAKDVKRKEAKPSNEITSSTQTLNLEVTYAEDELQFAYWLDGKIQNRQVVGTVDTADMSNSDFVGPVIGIYANSDSPQKVTFRDFNVQ